MLAAAFLATTLGFVLEARTLRPDGLLIASVAAAFAGWRAAEDASEERRVRWLALAYVALGAGDTRQGSRPVALVAVPVAGFTLRDHGWGGIRRLRPWLGLAIVLLITAPWHVAVAMRHPGFAWDYLVNQHLLFFLDKKLPRDSVGDPLTVFWGMFLGPIAALDRVPALHGRRGGARVPARGRRARAVRRRSAGPGSPR